MKALLFAAALVVPVAAAAQESSPDLKLAMKACLPIIKKLPSAGVDIELDGMANGSFGNGDQYLPVLFVSTKEGFQSKYLCLYDKHSKKAQASDINEP